MILHWVENKCNKGDFHTVKAQENDLTNKRQTTTTKKRIEVCAASVSFFME